MPWVKSVSVLPCSPKGTMIKHPVLTNGQGVNITLRRSIPGVFNILYYESPTVRLDITISKSSVPVGDQKRTVITAYLKSDIEHALQTTARVRLFHPLAVPELLEIMTNVRDALLDWPQFTNAADGPVVQVIMSETPVTWYQAEFEAERKPGSNAYWIGSTDLGLNVEKAIIENIAMGTAFQISEEEQLWRAASEQFADAAKANVRVV